jgi:hypothetical protein
MTPRECPRCRLINAPDAQVCDCGYELCESESASVPAVQTQVADDHAALPMEARLLAASYGALLGIFALLPTAIIWLVVGLAYVGGDGLGPGPAPAVMGLLGIVACAAFSAWAISRILQAQLNRRHLSVPRTIRRRFVLAVAVGQQAGGYTALLVLGSSIPVGVLAALGLHPQQWPRYAQVLGLLGVFVGAGFAGAVALDTITVRMASRSIESGRPNRG